MFRVIPILLLLLIPNIYGAQNSQIYLNVNYPAFHPEGKEFEVSFTYRFFTEEADSASFVVYTDLFRPPKITLRSRTAEELIDAVEINSARPGYRAYRVMLRDSFLVAAGPGQIMLRFDPGEKHDIELNYVFRLFAGRREFRYSSFARENQDIALSPVIISLYNPLKTFQSRSVLFTSGSVLSFKAAEGETENSITAFGFWAKFKRKDFGFLDVVNPATGDTALKLFVNRFGMLSVPEGAVYNSFSEGFISVNSWYRFDIIINKAQSSLDIYLNKELLFRQGVRFAGTGEFEAIISNRNARRKSLETDAIKIYSIASENALTRSETFPSGQITVKKNISRLLQNYYSPDEELYYTGLEFGVSDAPLFRRLPELNAQVYTGFINLEWRTDSFEEAKRFILEKSVDGKEFNEIYSVDAASEDQKYYYSDPLSAENTAGFYRLIQINKDGTKIYSQEVKVGSGQIEDFVLLQNYPNPFNPVTTIAVEIIKTADIEISVYNLVGIQAALLFEGQLSEGVYNFEFDGSNLPSGIYFCKVKSGLNSSVRKMILAK
ncbi:MAG: T9SS type A sorting domain-containing protein [Ignavibacteriales bacterium]|nr:T9SS type A sorting domain-containing protein [Ignavibacteriales bacterium]MCF8315728.1 T9SS type A sorting domain-containing protein [Ignavibacteriales bacterium]MCF8437078.1 T9SS type A sorting domain-containing protein [Ignavibacteriales bacterium]